MRPPLPQEDLDLVLSLTPEVWSRFRGARVFVTGGTGFIGSWLLEVIQRANTVLDAKIETIVLTRDPRAATERAPALFGMHGLTLVQGDVTNFDAPIGGFDLCIHAAAEVATAGTNSDQLKVFDGIVSGTARVLQACSKGGAAHVLLTSSGAVYGTQPPALSHVDEGFAGAPDPLDPSNAYGQGKRAAEWLASEHAARTGASVAVARIFALVGPNMPLDAAFAAGNFVRDTLAGRPIHIKGDGRPLRSYLYIADACAWLLRIAASGKRGQAYNVGSESEISISSLAHAVGRASGTKPQVHVLGRADESVLPPRYVPATSKARGELGLAEYTALDQALIKTINWSRSAAMP